MSSGHFYFDIQYIHAYELLRKIHGAPFMFHFPNVTSVQGEHALAPIEVMIQRDGL